jgi:hypothetical protein
MQRFDARIESCQGDAKRLRQCLVNGYKQNGARWVSDGTYRSIRGNTASLPLILPQSFHLTSYRCYMFTPILLSSQENRLRVGLSSMTSKRLKRYSMSFGLWGSIASSMTLGLIGCQSSLKLNQSGKYFDTSLAGYLTSRGRLLAQEKEPTA